MTPYPQQDLCPTCKGSGYIQKENRNSKYLLITKEELNDLVECNQREQLRIEKVVLSRPNPPAPAAPEPAREELIAFARFTQKFFKEGQEIMRKHNLCIDNLDDNMQKLAFTFYSNLCEIDSRARHLFRESYGEENYVDERLPAGVTYSPEHDATIRKDERNQTLSKLLKDVCKECPVHEEYMPLGDHCAESCDQCLVQSVVNKSLRTPSTQQHERGDPR